MTLVDSLIKEGWLETPRIIEAFRKINRKDFLPENIKDKAELNEALSIGFGQTISQPLTVAFMLEKLQPEPGCKVLDVGSGSGWTTALLSHIVSENGRVIAMEIIPELAEFGKDNVSKYNFIKKGVAEFVLGNGSLGYEKESPYDRILVSASAKETPQELKNQLKEGGRLVIPIKDSIWLFEKNPSAGRESNFKEFEYPGFAFVPLVNKPHA